MTNNILNTIAIVVISFVCMGLMSRVSELTNRLNTNEQLLEAFIRANMQHQKELVSLHKTIDSLKRTKPVVVKKKKRVKLDSAAVVHVENIIFHELLKSHVDSSMARILVAIAKHESNNFNSGLYQKNLNLFGMTYPPKRPTTAVGHTQFLDNGNVRRFCKFNSTASSVQDMVLYLKHRGYPLNIRSPEAMVRLMKSKRYFEAPEGLYLRAVKRHLNDLTIK